MKIQEHNQKLISSECWNMLSAKHLNKLQYIAQNVNKQHITFFNFIPISIPITTDINTITQYLPTIYYSYFTNI
jgi:hypothetical protein